MSAISQDGLGREFGRLSYTGSVGTDGPLYMLAPTVLLVEFDSASRNKDIRRRTGDRIVNEYDYLHAFGHLMFLAVSVDSNICPGKQDGVVAQHLVKIHMEGR
ncbi:hypothetical protein [Halovulum sp. GXIMD14793]